MARSGYSIAIEQSDIVVRLDRDSIDQVMLLQFLDYLELQTLRKRSQLNDEQASAIADEMDRAAWETVRPLFERE